jgi:spore maturation protein A
MLNYIWLALIILGILAAVWTDWSDLSADKYHNGEEYSVVVLFDQKETFPLDRSKVYPCTVAVRTLFDISQLAELTPSEAGGGVLKILVNGQTPPLWRSISDAQSNTEYLNARVTWNEPAQRIIPATLKFDPVQFVTLKAVTNEGIVKYAKIAVELAIGLIGIMALWLGIMKIAEQAGLIAKIAAFIKPVMTKLFPDVPPEHPAMGAMIMNISANILGLANAATPLGLKAMEELNKLNKKLGTATDAMCTFLVINTSNVQLIPATVVAIRAAAGSTSPTEIIGPVIAATTISTVVGVITVKLMARMRIFKVNKEQRAVGTEH